MNPLVKQILDTAVSVLVLPALGAAGLAAVALFQYFAAKATIAKNDLLRSVATDAKDYAKEKGAVLGLTGPQRAEEADRIVAAKLPKVSEADRKAAVVAAVGADPTAGESAKEKKPPMFPADPTPVTPVKVQS